MRYLFVFLSFLLGFCFSEKGKNGDWGAVRLIWHFDLFSEIQGSWGTTLRVADQEMLARGSKPLAINQTIFDGSSDALVCALIYLTRTQRTLFLALATPELFFIYPLAVTSMV